jgi:phosphosulfolactate synthase (CoM biosynthesis protein A)
VGDGIDYIWGPGTAARLTTELDSSLSALADEAAELGQEAYEVAEDVTIWSIEQIDDRFGAGTVDELAEEARQFGHGAVNFSEGMTDGILEEANNIIQFWTNFP